MIKLGCPVTQIGRLVANRIKQVIKQLLLRVLALQQVHITTKSLRLKLKPMLSFALLDITVLWVQFQCTKSAVQLANTQVEALRRAQIVQLAIIAYH
jgi:hypothetical protein